MAFNLLDPAEFADNPEPRCPVVLFLDTSGSMVGKLRLSKSFSVVAHSQPGEQASLLPVGWGQVDTPHL